MAESLVSSWLNPKTAIKAVTTLGVSVVLALAFAYYLITAIPETKALAQEILLKVGVLEKDHAMLRESLPKALDRIADNTCAMCLNDAEDDAEKIRRCNCILQK